MKTQTGDHLAVDYSLVFPIGPRFHFIAANTEKVTAATGRTSGLDRMAMLLFMHHGSPA
ncbi:MAG: hypothetical protein ACU84H_16595 [Gammaproteobacteria bacterium]